MKILPVSLAIIVGVAILKSKILSRWIGGVGIIVGAITIVAGLGLEFWVFSC